MTDRQLLAEQLLRHESLRLFPYTDTVGKVSIGVGRNLTDTGITHAEAMLMLDHDIDDAVQDLATFPWFGTLNAVRQRAVIDFRFNVGPGTFRKFTATIAALAREDYAAAAKQLRASKWYRQVHGRGEVVALQIEKGVEA